MYTNYLFSNNTKGGLTFAYLSSVSETCPDPDAPINGALACDVWLGGRLCHPSCAKGYSVLVTKRLPSLIICLDDGRWLHREKITSCIGSKSNLTLYNYFQPS